MAISRALGLCLSVVFSPDFLDIDADNYRSLVMPSVLSTMVSDRYDKCLG